MADDMMGERAEEQLLMVISPSSVKFPMVGHVVREEVEGTLLTASDDGTARVSDV